MTAEEAEFQADLERVEKGLTAAKEHKQAAAQKAANTAPDASTPAPALPLAPQVGASCLCMH